MSAPDFRLLAPASSSSRAAFTLLELLVVISIIALISAISLPVLRSLKPDPLKTASNQLLNDLAYARHRALADHTTVYVAFMPPVDLLDVTVADTTKLTPNEKVKMLKAQFNGYAMYEKRSAGDQPGAGMPHWIGNWRTLPQGTAFPAEMFHWTGPERGAQAMAQVGFGYWSFDFTNAGPMLINPDANPASYVYSRFPTIAFDYRGSLVPPWNDWKPWLAGGPVGYQIQNSSSGFDCVIPVTQAFTSPNTTAWQSAGYRENPPGCFTNIYTHVVIDGPTGRARRDVRALQ